MTLLDSAFTGDYDDDSFDNNWLISIVHQNQGYKLWRFVWILNTRV